MKPKGFQGDLTTLANRQEVPHRGGAQVGGLFRGDNTLNTTKSDERAIDNASKGAADGGFLGVIKADSQLTAALKAVKQATTTVMEARSDLLAAYDAIEVAQAEKDAEDAAKEIAALKGDAEKIRSALEFIDNGPAKIAKLLEEGVEKLSHVGSVCALVFSTLPVAGLTAAEAKLAQAQTRMKAATAAGLQHRLEAAKSKALAALQVLSEKKANLHTAMTARREAYDEAGRQAGAASHGGPASSAKVAAFISAIPVAEIVVANLRNIVDKTRYGLALQHQTEQAWNLPVAIGTLEYCQTYFGAALADWTERLQALIANKDRIAGERPETGSDE